MSYIESCELLPTYQSAYRKGFSTETVLVKLSNDILWHMENQSAAALVCIDLSAAFDTVHHGILLNVSQQKFGVEETALSWFNSYLRPRSAKVLVGEEFSKSTDLSFSVPQGSICGPVLYTAYASTLPGSINDCDLDILGYADDHSLYMTHLILEL